MMASSPVIRLLAISALIVAANPAAAQNPPQPNAAPPSAANSAAGAVRVMRATRLSGSIKIDGKLNEAAWGSAVPAGDFTQSYQIGRAHV